jgi:hypothetical protein
MGTNLTTPLRLRRRVTTAATMFLSAGRPAGTTTCRYCSRPVAPGKGVWHGDLLEMRCGRASCDALAAADNTRHLIV